MHGRAFRVNIVSVLILGDTCWPALVSGLLPGFGQLSACLAVGGASAVRGWVSGAGPGISAGTSRGPPVRSLLGSSDWPGSEPSGLPVLAGAEKHGKAVKWNGACCRISHLEVWEA